MDVGGSSSGLDLHGVASGKGEANHDPQKSTIIAETGRQGEIGGIPSFQNVISRAGNEIGNKIVTDSQVIKEQLKKRDISVIETKKRRTDNELDVGNDLDRNKDIIMESEDDILSAINEKTADNNNNSKNRFVAGTHGSARLSL